MFGLLLENLKLYKMHYLYNILTLIFLMFIMIEFKFYEFYFSQVMIIFSMFTPEFIRINMILNDGYLKLLNKLPISYNDLYRHKLLVSSSGMILNLLLLITINFFIKLPDDFFNTINLLTTNLFAGIIVQNSTNIYNSPRPNTQLGWDFKSMLSFIILFLGFFGIFGFMTTTEINIYGNINNTYNYLICLILQLIFLYYSGKLYFIIRGKKFTSKHLNQLP